MNKGSEFILKALRKTYAKVMRVPPLPKPVCEHDPDVASQIIYDKLAGNEPCMIARFGSTELSAMINYLGVKKNDRNILRYISGKSTDWWWSENIINQMRDWSGFFPSTIRKIEEFGKLMMEDIKEIDILASWRPEEALFFDEIGKSDKVLFELLNPYFSKTPWTVALKGKRILVVHPFAYQIEKQYEKRLLLFDNHQILPEFNLSTIKAVQSLGGENVAFKDWFDALNWMKQQIDNVDYDICLIGCGAYGLPLAAHVKRTGKKAVHIGGALQLLFGIKGKRWENPNYNSKYNYSKLMNSYWVYPDESTKPKNAKMVEGACYW